MRGVVFLLSLMLLAGGLMEGRKIKNTLKIEKEAKGKDEGKNNLKGILINLDGPVSDSTVNDSLYQRELLKVSFAGYDKEINSNTESFIIINPTDLTITGYEVRIDYLDLQDRMLHSRVVSKSCDVPPGETRKEDIKSWDIQHTYYYHLGNEPKKVATPYKVSLQPLSFRIEPL